MWQRKNNYGPAVAPLYWQSWYTEFKKNKLKKLYDEFVAIKSFNVALKF
jgi:hypothetical protein